MEFTDLSTHCFHITVVIKRPIVLPKASTHHPHIVDVVRHPLAVAKSSVDLQSAFEVLQRLGKLFVSSRDVSNVVKHRRQLAITPEFPKHRLRLAEALKRLVVFTAIEVHNAHPVYTAGQSTSVAKLASDRR